MQMHGRIPLWEEPAYIYTRTCAGGSQCGRSRLPEHPAAVWVTPKPRADPARIPHGFRMDSAWIPHGRFLLKARLLAHVSADA